MVCYHCFEVQGVLYLRRQVSYLLRHLTLWLTIQGVNIISAAGYTAQRASFQSIIKAFLQSFEIKLSY